MVLNARISELEALNYILDQAGELPVNALTNLPRNGQRALSALREITLAEQSDTSLWHMNTRKCILLPPDATTKKIQLAANVVSVSARRTREDLAARGEFLYDLANDTFEFEQAVEVDMRIVLDWDELPVQHRWYFQRVAARTYQERWVKNIEKRNIDLEAETRARAAAVSAEITSSKISMLQNPEIAHYNSRYI